MADRAEEYRKIQAVFRWRAEKPRQRRSPARIRVYVREISRTKNYGCRDGGDCGKRPAERGSICGDLCAEGQCRSPEGLRPRRLLSLYDPRRTMEDLLVYRIFQKHSRRRDCESATGTRSGGIEEL